MFGCPDVNSIAAIAFKIINNTRAEFFGKHIFKTILIDNFSWRFERFGDYNMVMFFQLNLVDAFCFLNDFLAINGKTQASSFLGAVQINWHLVNILSKYVFMHRSTKFFRIPVLHYVNSFNVESLITNIPLEETINICVC